MKLYSSNDNYKLYQGNMLDMLDVIEPNSIDSIVTDPPYGLTSITKRYGKKNSVPVTTKNNDGSFARLTKGFMGKEWDGSGIEYNIETWEKCYDVLKDGGYLLAFGGSRTFHRIACAIEDAGFEIRDTIMWLYGSGFPKSMNVGKMYDKKIGNDRETIGETRIGKTSLGDNSGWDTSKNMKELKASGKVDITKGNSKWEGWGSCLKPSFEPIIVARKPFKGSLVDNIIKNGVGGINIDDCRVEINGELIDNHNVKGTPFMRNSEDYQENSRMKLNIGRFPANTILTYDETDFDEVCGGFPNTKSTYNSEIKHENIIHRDNADFLKYGYKSRIDSSSYNDSGNASRYFYCAKASKRDRDEGLDDFELKTDKSKGNGLDRICEYCGVSQLTPELCKCENKSWITKPRKNMHPTVKPTSLMQYLVRLVTPNNGIILDPFNGSGSTGKAVMYENKERNKNYKYIGIEMTEEYLPISKARIEYVYNQIKDSKVQISIDDME